MRRISLLLGLGAVVYGSIRLQHAHSVAGYCASTPSGQTAPGSGSATSCIDQVGMEYLSFALILVGGVITAIALVLMHRRRREYALNASSTISSVADRRLLGTPGEDPALRRSRGHVVPSGPWGTPPPPSGPPGEEIHQKSA